MAATDGRLIDLAGAILDGTPIDWVSAVASADQSDRALLDQLKALAAIAALHSAPGHALTRSAIAPHAAAEQPVEGPETWGHLRVFARVGRGAFGDVFRAWDTRLDREVALKLLPAEAVADSRATSIIEEGRLLARVRHPNIVTIYGADRIDGRVGLWMEFIHGRTLEQVLNEGHAFNAEEAIGIGAQLCDAMAAVHRAGLLHRDIKAQNVMLAEDGRVVLMDFGTGREFVDRSSGLAGTPLYLAPELLGDGAPTVRTDIYSIGVLLFHLLTDSYPVQAQSLRELRAAHEGDERLELRAARRNLSPKLIRVIERAIDPAPERRYESAVSLSVELKALKARRMPRALTYGLAASVVLALLAWTTWEIRARQVANRSGAGASVAGAGALNPAERPVIAVLPFKNLSDAPNSDYFADGLTDEIIRNLATVKGLEVRSQTSSFAFKGKPRSLRDVGEQLGANLAVEGSVLRSGDRLRINAQLVQVAGDVPLWSDKFDRQLQDVFAIQDDIARAIVNALRLTLGTGQRRYDTNIEAYDLYLRARALIARRAPGDEVKAAELFEQVVARDAAFAPAYAGLVYAFAVMSLSPYGSEGGGRGVPYEVVQGRMRAAAEKALQVDPLLAEAHAAMGWIHSREFEWRKAEQSFTRALDLDSSLTQTRIDYSLSTLRPLGKHPEAEQLLRLALRNDPLSLEVRRELANVLLETRRYDEALATLQSTVASDPSFPVTTRLPRALTLSGRANEAIPVLERSGRGAQQYLAWAYVMAGRRADAEKLAIGNQGFPFREAIIYAALGDKERAFEALDRMAASEPQRLGLTLVFPEMAGLRDDPRYDALRKKIHLPPLRR